MNPEGTTPPGVDSSQTGSRDPRLSKEGLSEESELEELIQEGAISREKFSAHTREEAKRMLDEYYELKHRAKETLLEMSQWGGSRWWWQNKVWDFQYWKAYSLSKNRFIRRFDWEARDRYRENIKRILIPIWNPIGHFLYVLFTPFRELLWWANEWREYRPKTNFLYWVGTLVVGIKLVVLYIVGVMLLVLPIYLFLRLLFILLGKGDH